MDERAAREAAKVLATLIGEIMEDHVDLALTAGAEAPSSWAATLRVAGEEIAILATAIEILEHRTRRSSAKAS